MKTLLAALVLSLSCSVTASAIDVGDAAPKFQAKDDSGEIWKSEDHVGKKILVVYFYPADMTGGCTKQACGYRDKMKDFTDAGVEVVGVSGDTVENHKIFKEVHDLNFALLADTEGKVAKAFGVPVTVGDKSVVKMIENVEKELVRKATAKRWTFVIDREGNVAYKDSQVNAAQDPEKIAAVIAKLK
ncbi:peroxiredoxin [Rhodopirellula sp. MGV]|uniref:peroxiredoxin n=1 Tax=Rhodopirellula sp. MGV TaxID=2023130 RepID=UPI000B966F50|nr:peroxiredoxin [Rhodopirellula sp. MGV]OYP30995.1 peroxiredoxin [Rhodopirellula sp. MGV]PNY34659.1 peroxiredoxin [Rhodopirellula baltica]